MALNLDSIDLQTPEGAALSAGKSSPQRAHDAAQQFESLMIAQIMKSIREDEGAGFCGETDNASDTALGMAEEYFAQALSRSGGFGIAKVVEAGLTTASAKPKHGPVQKLQE